MLANALADRAIDAVFSYAGRTARPVRQRLATRIGGFGGVDGLVNYLRENRITHLIDATHPFAAQISTNAVAASARTGVPLCAFERPAWQAQAGDDWRCVSDIGAAVRALPMAPARVFLAIGKQNLTMFGQCPQHQYLLRLVDPPQGQLPLVNARAVIARGPFELAQDLALLRDHQIDLIVAKNAGGSGARAKLDAARALGLPVVLIDRPVVPTRRCFSALDDVWDWLGHAALRGV